MLSSSWSLLFLLSFYSTILCCLSSDAGEHDLNQDDPHSNHHQAGVDVSWPMHRFGNLHPSIEERGRRSRRYVQYMQGCALHYSDDECHTSDGERMSMIRKQPPLMQNYTSAGYAKVKAPSSVFATLKDFYEQHFDRHVTEQWPPGNIYVNHWASPTDILPLAGLEHDATQPSLSTSQRHALLAEIQPILEAWCKMPLLPTSIYGIRLYRRGAILAPHVDRLPLVISAVVNVFQSGLEEDWPIEVIDHNGVAVNITLQEGEMLLYEGTSVIHGRPYPLNGQFYANVFIHFEPVGHSQRHMHLRKDPQTLFEEALAKQQQEKTDTDDNSQESEEIQKKRPYYVPANKIDAWEQRYVYVKKINKLKSSGSPSKKSAKVMSSSISSHNALDTDEDEEVETNVNAVPDRLFHNLAAKGMLMRMKEMVMEDPSVVTKTDHNGWLALHEAARAGHTRVVNYLCELMDQNEINTRTNGGKGATPLWWALHMFNEDHPTVKALIKHGAKSIGPNVEG